MSRFDTVRVLLTLVIIAEAFDLELYYATLDSRTCKKLVTDPDFEVELVVGKQWRVYYAWNFENHEPLHDRCQDIKFKNATPTIINRIWNDMYEYLTNQPEWSTAVLLMNMAPSQEMLLFSNDGIPGSFIGVANILRTDIDLPTKKHTVPLFKIHIKLLKNSKWMVVSDCNIGFTTLSARVDLVPYCSEEDIMSIVRSLDIGEGVVVCAADQIY